MNSIVKSLYATFVVLIHSKRTWAVISAMTMLVVKECYPQYSESIMSALAIIGTWILGESWRPAQLNKVLSLVAMFLLASATFANQAYSQDSSNVDGRRCDETTVEPFRKYSDGYSIAKAEGRPLLVFVSGKNCGPCKVFKREVLEPLRLKKQLEDCVLVEVDGESTDGLALTKTRMVPQVIAFVDGFRYAIMLPVTREKFIALLDTIRAQKKAQGK